jgi:hypothetical protein
MSANEKPVRRIVCVDENEKSRAISDAPVRDVLTDPGTPRLQRGTRVGHRPHAGAH